MKKKLLYLTCLLSYGLYTNSMNAQTMISFEASEGFSTGTINAQNGWYVTSDEDGNFISEQEISSAMASNGTQSFKIDEDPTFSPQTTPVMGAFYDFADPLASTHYTIEADFYISEDGGANFQMAIAGAVNYIALFQFDFENNFRTVETVNNVTNWSNIPNLAWQPQTWYTIKIEVEGNVTKYYIDGTLARTGTTLSSEQFEHMQLTHDNWGGYAHIDNIIITDLNSASTYNPEKFEYNVYPNPATNAITIAMKDNSRGLDQIAITDLNGRTVKTFELNKENEITLDISDVASGIYLMRITSQDAVETRKIVKK